MQDSVLGTCTVDFGSTQNVNKNQPLPTKLVQLWKAGGKKMENPFSWQLNTFFQSPPTRFQYFIDFQLGNKLR